MFLQTHNDARKPVGVEPLQWSEEMASYASALAQHPPGSASCNFSLVNAASSKYGQNQAMGYVLDSPATVVGWWVNDGREYYNHERNLCAEEHQYKCDSYTQVVWKKTVKFGCGKGNCGNVGSHNICLYYPPGNVPGEKPY